MNFCELKGILEREHKEYQGIPFWSWNNEICEEELLKQIEDMKSARIGGFIMHARAGMKIEYLGEKWFSCVEACLRKAKELGMEAWIYDENGWPSGFVGGKLLETVEFRAQFLEYEVKADFDETAFAVYKKTAEGYVLLGGKEDGVTEYHTVYLRTSPANTDILNPEVVSAFICETHEKYYERFGDSFGKEFVGFFTDEPQFYTAATPYSRCVAEEFSKQGKDVKAGLIYLFNSDEQGYEFKTEYFQVINRLYTENYYRRIYEWCEAHGCKLTGHSFEESGLGHQMAASAGVMPSYEYEHMPAVDWLGRFLPTEIITRQIASMASQFEKKYVLTEIFACCGYETPPRELRSVAEFYCFGGVNRLCHHLYPYSVAAQGKHDCPPNFGRQGNWFEEFAIFNQYFERLGYLVGETKEIYDIAIIHPLRDCYRNYTRKEHLLSISQEEAEFEKLLAFLSTNGVTYHLIDEAVLLRHGKTQEGVLTVGACEYGTIVVPKMKSMMSSTLDILRSYTGKILNLGKIEYLDGCKQEAEIPSNTSFDEIIAGKKIPFKGGSGRYSVTARKGELGEFIFVKNLSGEEPCSFTLGNAEQYRRLNLVDVTFTKAEERNELSGLGSAIFVKSDEDSDCFEAVSEADITDVFSMESITENYLVIDKVSYSYDGVSYSPAEDVQKVFETLLRTDYKGKLFVKYRFDVKHLLPLKLMAESSHYTSFAVNGNEVRFTPSDFDSLFVECDVTNFVKLGENEIVYSIDFYEHDGVRFALFDPMATESLRNCLYFDTSIENVYLKGDFSLDENLSICKRQLPKAISSLEKQGFPFFTGAFTVSGSYFYDGVGNRELQADGGYLVAKIRINGKTADLIMDDKTDVTQLLTVGENRIEISFKVGLRNLFGPLHYEKNNIFPSCFTFRGEWEKGVPAEYQDRYVLTSVGVNSVKIRTLKAKL